MVVVWNVGEEQSRWLRRRARDVCGWIVLFVGEGLESWGDSCGFMLDGGERNI